MALFRGRFSVVYGGSLSSSLIPSEWRTWIEVLCVSVAIAVDTDPLLCRTKGALRRCLTLSVQPVGTG
ncbi:hypothetical protein NPIL_245991 [Nephila pilipes]|uniref:Uncharacterized protein n=1 Tax=Nephila pilipes TaxID=299642 RepID=A0A8X6MBL3_NEPPI|nr:hypothetical protein NPIL_245991 [Nephila pilipes]